VLEVRQERHKAAGMTSREPHGDISAVGGRTWAPLTKDCGVCVAWHAQK
jgi:hypothetical protein